MVRLDAALINDPLHEDAMNDQQDSVPEAASQPPKGGRGSARSKITPEEARDRKNDAKRVASYLALGGCITRDRPKWRRASMTGDLYNAHVCERLLKQSRIVQVPGSVGTFSLPKAQA